MPTLTAIEQAFIDETQIGIYGTGTFAAASLTDTTQLQNGNYQGNEYKGWWLGHPGSNTTADRQKPVASNGLAPTTGVITHGGSNITVTGAGLAYTLTRPDWPPTRYIVPLVNRALELAWQWWRAPLTLIANGDGEASSVGGSDVSATTTRNTTAAYVFSGQASLRAANSGANGYHQYADFDAAAGRAFRAGAWLRIASGTGVLQVVDRSNGDAVLASITVTGVGQWHYVQVSGSFPATCYLAALRVGGTQSNADTYWDDACIYWEPATRIAGPSWVTQWRDDKGRPAFRLLRYVNRLVGDGSGPGRAYDLKLIDPGDYQVVNLPSAANAVEFELGRKITQGMGSMPLYPVIIEARRPFSDFGTLSDGDDSTSCPLRLVVAGMKRLAANDRNSPHADITHGGDGAYQAVWEREQLRVASHLTLPLPDEHGQGWQELR